MKNGVRRKFKRWMIVPVILFGIMITNVRNGSANDVNNKIRELDTKKYISRINNSDLSNSQNLIGIILRNVNAPTYHNLVHTLDQMIELDFNHGVTATKFNTRLQLVNTEIQELNSNSLDSLKSSSDHIAQLVDMASKHLYEDQIVIAGTDLNRNYTIARELSIANEYMALRSSIVLSSSQIANLVTEVNDLAELEHNPSAVNNYHQFFGNLSKLNSNSYQSLFKLAESSHKLTTDLNSDLVTSALDTVAQRAGDLATNIRNSSMASSYAKSVNDSIANSYQQSISNSVTVANHSKAVAAAQSADRQIETSIAESEAKSANQKIADYYRNSTASSIINDHRERPKTNYKSNRDSFSHSASTINNYSLGVPEVQKSIDLKIAEIGISKPEVIKLHQLVNEGCSVKVAKQCVILERSPKI